MKLKFRAYNKEINKMIYLDPLQWPLKSLDEEENWKVMMWTGLLDRHGKEIYEGDIIYGPHDYGPGGWVNRKGTIHFDIEKGYQWSYWDITKTEVIGNIYENHELLPSTKERGLG